MLYDALFIKMNKKVLESILKHTLIRLPKAGTQKWSEILSLPMVAIQSRRLKQQAQIDSLVLQINCDFVLSQKFRVCQRNQNIQFNLAHQFLKQNTVTHDYPRKQSNTIQNLIFQISELEKNKQQLSVYSEIQSLLDFMDDNDLQRAKPYLFYLHTWTLRQQEIQKQKRSPDSARIQCLRESLVRRLASSYIHKRFHSEVFEQIQETQLITKARFLIAEKKYIEAIIAFESIYEDKNNSEITRMEALSSLCGYCFSSGDVQYLRKMTVRMIEQKCGDKHIEYIQKILRQAEVLEGGMTLKQQEDQNVGEILL